MGADIATLNDIHAAYIRGSVPTAAQESDDILNQPFSDEVAISACFLWLDCCVRKDGLTVILVAAERGGQQGEDAQRVHHR